MSKNYVIDEARLRSLLRSGSELIGLESAGVDNWPGYGEHFDMGPDFDDMMLNEFWRPGMKVRELIEFLQLQDPEMEVIVRGNCRNHSLKPLDKAQPGQGPATKNRVVLEGGYL